MKLIHVLLCMLFGMMICISTVCSDEAGDEYQDEVQDADDESPNNDVNEIAKTTPSAIVATISAPAQTATSVEPTTQATAVQNTSTALPAVATVTGTQESQATNGQSIQNAAVQNTDTSNTEKLASAIIAKSSTQSDTAQNQPSVTNTAPTNTPTNQTNLEQSQQTKTASLLATKNNQDDLFDSSLPETIEPGEPEPAVPAENQDKTNLSTVLTTGTTGAVSTSATVNMPQTLETKSSDSPVQPSTDAISPNQTAPNRSTNIQDLSEQTVSTPLLETAASDSQGGIDQVWPAASQESTFKPATQKPFSNTIDIKNTDAETILSSIGTLPQPRKLSDLNTQESAVDESLEVTLSGPLTKKSVGQAIAQLAPLIMSRSVEKAVEQFTNLPAEKAWEILERLIKTSKTDFTKKNKGRPFEVKRNDFLQIIFGVASQYHDVAVYNQFFDLIDRYPGLANGVRPVLFVLSISSYPVLIPALIAWLEAKGVENSVRGTGIYAIDRTSGRAINALSTYARSAFEPVLGSLLLYAISNKKPIKIIRVLVDAGADPNYADASGYTPLIKAVEMDNLRAIKLLVENGADIDLIIKDEIGSAWQKSSELPKGTIMEYLQKNAPTKHKTAKDIAF